MGGGYLIYNKYLSYKERKRKEKIYHSKKAHKYNRKQAAFHADGTPMTEKEMLTPSFLREHKNRKDLRRLRVYFDQEDLMIDEETAMKDNNNYYHKYHVIELDMIHTN
jgi:hypothetical protein